MMIQRSSAVLNNTSNGNGIANHIISFSGIQIETTVTKRASVVADWISGVYSNYGGTRIVVGFVSDRYEILQLCVEKTCLILQLHHMDEFPQALQNFLKDYDIMFVGVNMRSWSIISNLQHKFGLDCSRVIEAIDLGMSSYVNSITSRLGRDPTLHDLAKHLEGLNTEKPVFIGKSDWKAERLYVEQIRYASIDACATYKIARKLLSSNI